MHGDIRGQQYRNFRESYGTWEIFSLSCATELDCFYTAMMEMKFFQEIMLAFRAKTASTDGGCPSINGGSAF
jgi:hypothetical protein